jgi:membrane-associated phospholipid phosphatase
MNKSEAGKQISPVPRSLATTSSVTTIVREAANEPVMPVREKLLVSAGILVSFAVLFLGLDRLIAQTGGAGAHVVNPETWIDAYIPFVPQFVFAYLLYYPWVLMPVPILRSRAEFYHAVSAFALCQLSASTIFLLFPSYMTRPAVIGDGLPYELLRDLYHLDNGCNLIPSLHVAHSMLVALFFRALRPKLFPIVAFGTVMISASTVLVKQHYFLDIPAGMALAIVAYYASVPVYHRLRNRSSSSQLSFL